MDSNQLRRLVAEVDEEHRSAMRELRDVIAADVTDADDAARASRRAFLRKVGLGGALVGATVPLVAGVAAAQTTTTAGEATDATTTTAPPRRPTTEDAVVLAVAQALELAAAQAYEAAAAKNLLSESALSVALAFRQHHREHSQAFGGLIGRSAPSRASAALFEQFAPRIEAAKTEGQLLLVAFDLENAAAATYTAVLGRLEGTEGAQMAAGIQPIESRHATVIGQMLDLDLERYIPPFQTTADAVSADNLPVG